MKSLWLFGAVVLLASSAYGRASHHEPETGLPDIFGSESEEIKETEVITTGDAAALGISNGDETIAVAESEDGGAAYAEAENADGDETKAATEGDGLAIAIADDEGTTALADSFGGAAKSFSKNAKGYQSEAQTQGDGIAEAFSDKYGTVALAESDNDGSAIAISENGGKKKGKKGLPDFFGSNKGKGKGIDEEFTDCVNGAVSTVKNGSPKSHTHHGSGPGNSAEKKGHSSSEECKKKGPSPKKKSSPEYSESEKSEETEVITTGDAAALGISNGDETIAVAESEDGGAAYAEAGNADGDETKAATEGDGLAIAIADDEGTTALADSFGGAAKSFSKNAKGYQSEAQTQGDGIAEAFSDKYGTVALAESDNDGSAIAISENGGKKKGKKGERLFF